MLLLLLLLTAYIGVVNIQTALCYVKVGIGFFASNVGTMFFSNISPFPGILSHGYRITISHIHKLLCFFTNCIRSDFTGHVHAGNTYMTFVWKIMR